MHPKHAVEGVGQAWAALTRTACCKQGTIRCQGRPPGLCMPQGSPGPHTWLASAPSLVISGPLHMIMGMVCDRRYQHPRGRGHRSAAAAAARPGAIGQCDHGGGLPSVTAVLALAVGVDPKLLHKVAVVIAVVRATGLLRACGGASQRRRGRGRPAAGRGSGISGSKGHAAKGRRAALSRDSRHAAACGGRRACGRPARCHKPTFGEAQRRRVPAHAEPCGPGQGRLTPSAHHARRRRPRPQRCLGHQTWGMHHHLGPIAAQGSGATCQSAAQGGRFAPAASSGCRAVRARRARTA